MHTTWGWLLGAILLTGCQQAAAPIKSSPPPRILRAEGTAKHQNAHMARQIAYNRAVAEINQQLNGVEVTEEQQGGERVIQTRSEGVVPGAQIERTWTDDDGTVHVAVRCTVPQRP